ncbi:MAG: hypothetical protein COV70_03490 [Parcubacteria group bacterium CG11_big_fil_rev_8_21_14_0_20_39_22]|nr:MAG: hypothetical protein COV70_03490 [Parcubacteria group bacterium CG11_big_fil_rev_8_21_14_0_20_39_22]
MGFFGKDKITKDELIDNVADMVFNSTSAESLKPYSDMLKNMKETPEINERQQREILVLEMLAITRTVSKLGDKISNPKEFLDKFHEKIYSRISDDEKKQVEFEEMVQNRYQTYYQILASKEENMMFFFGKQFTDYFLDKDVKHQGLVMFVSVAQIFALHIENFEKMIREIFSKFDVV